MAGWRGQVEQGPLLADPLGWLLWRCLQVNAIGSAVPNVRDIVI